MSRQPNVIVFFTDQKRWDTTGINGNHFKTRNAGGQRFVTDAEVGA